MKLDLSSLVLCLSTATVLTLHGCGGGGTGETVAGGGTPPLSSISGTAATGAALGNANVTITDSTGTSPCEQATITTTALGSYSCTLKAGKTAPFFVVVTDPTGNTPPLVSIQTTTPAAGDNLTVNVTPLTTAIVAQLSPTGNALSIVAGGTVDAAQLKSITTNVVAQLANILASVEAPAGYNPFTTSITAATASGVGNTADRILDVVRIVSTGTGALAFSTVDNPTPILLATATTTGVVAAPLTDGVSTLSRATQIAAQVFTGCFAVPTTQRVLTKDDTIPVANGGPKVGDSAPQCQNIVANVDNGAGVTFLQNGYNAGQFFYGLLTSDQMTGAQFSVPEIMLFAPAVTSAVSPSLERFDRAILNIKFIDNAGNPGNLITVAARLTGTATTTRPTDWWLVGNQQLVDTSTRLNIRRVEQLNAGNTNTFRMSTYMTGIQFNINAKGPGSELSGGQLLNIARVTGPGLPTAGLVYRRSSGAQSSMDLFNKTGNLTGGLQCGNGSTASCPNIWLARTMGLTGTNASTLAANPVSLLWAQPGEGFDAAQIIKGARYKIELFYGSNVGTADRTVFKTLLSNLVNANQGVNLAWNTLGPKSLAALDPNGSLAGTQVNTLALDWVQNPSAEQIGGITGVIDNFGTFGPNRFVPRGVLSAILNNHTIPSFSTTTGNRTLFYGYRMVDGSGKQGVYQYN